jgi:hypothetical protein
MSENESVVATEVKRQTVILLFSTAGTIIAVYVMYKLSEPDLWRTTKMKLALKVKHLAQTQVEWWQSIADKAATLYNQERL